MKKILILISAYIIFSTTVFAQAVDEERMNRDIEVAERVLSTLLREESSNRAFYLESIEGTFISDYGVIFSIPNSLRKVWRGINTVSVGEGNTMVVDKDGEGYTYTIKAKNLADAESKIRVINLDSIQTVERKESIEVMKIFLTDYGNIVSQLNDSHKILITNDNGQFELFNRNRTHNELSVEASVADINKFKNGDISRDEMMKRIKVTDRKVEGEKSTDLELFSTILERLYRSDLSNTYYTNRNISYDRLSDFGVIYKMKVYSSTEDDGGHTVTTRDIKGLTQEERDKIVKEMYPEFISSLKESILDYGKMINTLKDEEIIMVQVSLTKCVGCDIPKSISLSVKNEALQKYNSGELSRKDALAKISIKVGEKQ